MKVLIFGATGSAGGSVVRACLASPYVEEVRVVVRRPLPLEDAKLRTFVHSDFLDYSAIAAAFQNIDAIFWCLGISVRQVSNDDYYRITHDFAIAAARTMQQESPKAAFVFISGMSTKLDSRMMWARVKAQTEQELMQLVGAVCIRPAAIDGVPSASEPELAKILRPLFRVLRGIRSIYIKGEDLGLAMIEIVREGMRNRILENTALRDLADRLR
ncbi:MAG: NAD(P)H-binding protein [Acidobacteria bacterium]|nr:NAD(P)H-binding protein [Acidobacteriota bacterium]